MSISPQSFLQEGFPDVDPHRTASAILAEVLRLRAKGARPSLSTSAPTTPPGTSSPPPADAPSSASTTTSPPLPLSGPAAGVKARVPKPSMKALEAIASAEPEPPRGSASAASKQSPVPLPQNKEGPSAEAQRKPTAAANTSTKTVKESVPREGGRASDGKEGAANRPNAAPASSAASPRPRAFPPPLPSPRMAPIYTDEGVAHTGSESRVGPEYQATLPAMASSKAPPIYRDTPIPTESLYHFEQTPNDEHCIVALRLGLRSAKRGSKVKPNDLIKGLNWGPSFAGRVHYYLKRRALYSTDEAVKCADCGKEATAVRRCCHPTCANYVCHRVSGGLLPLPLWCHNCYPLPLGSLCFFRSV